MVLGELVVANYHSANTGLAASGAGVQALTLLLAIEHDFIRGVVGRWLAGNERVRVVGTARDLSSAEQAARALAPDLIFISTVLGEQPTFGLCKELAACTPPTRAIYLCHKANDRDIALALDSGSQWCIGTCDSIEDACGVIAAAIANTAGHSTSIRERLAAARASGVNLKKPTRGQTLSGRQCEVLRYVAVGLSKREVAEKMHISPRTVERHVANIMTVLNIHDRVHLTRYAIREGLVEA